MNNLLNSTLNLPGLLPPSPGNGDTHQTTSSWKLNKVPGAGGRERKLDGRTAGRQADYYATSIHILNLSCLFVHASGLSFPRMQAETIKVAVPALRLFAPQSIKLSRPDDSSPLFSPLLLLSPSISPASPAPVGHGLRWLQGGRGHRQHQNDRQQTAPPEEVLRLHQPLRRQKLGQRRRQGRCYPREERGRHDEENPCSC
jgi:hypothetical protein